MRDAVQHFQAVAVGKRSKVAGAFWEEMIDAACRHYRAKGIAEISKTPEPMRQISAKNSKGQFIACYTKQAQPDYKGTLAGGRAVVFEAKHTDGGRMNRSVISPEQEKQLNSHTALGAVCFVMVSFGFQRYFKVPWPVFRDMKQRYGRKYITPEDVGEYEIKYSGGVLRFLG